MITKCKFCGRELSRDSSQCRRCKTSQAPEKSGKKQNLVFNVIIGVIVGVLGLTRLFLVFNINTAYSLLFATQSMSFAVAGVHLCIALSLITCGCYVLKNNKYARKCLAATLAVDSLNTLFNSGVLFSTTLTAPERSILPISIFISLFIVEICVFTVLIFSIFFEEKKRTI